MRISYSYLNILSVVSMSVLANLRPISKAASLYLGNWFSRDQSSGFSHKHDIYDKFIGLLNEKGVEQHQSAYYAEMLHISLNHLNNIIKEVSGKTVYQCINSFLITEAKAALIHTSLTVQLIADQLHFPSSPFFCRFFLAHTGKRPSQFRKDI